MEHLLALFAFLVIAYLGYQYYLSMKAPVAKVECGPVLVKSYGLAGTEVTEQLKVVDTDGNAVPGVSIYSFSTKPYYWDKPELWQYLNSIVSASTPVATTDSNGEANISVKIPETTSISYVVLKASGYWTEPYVFNIGINPIFTASSEEKCLEVYPYNSVVQILPKLVEVKAKRLIDGAVFTLDNLQVVPLAQYTTINPISFGISESKLGASIKGVSVFYITKGDLRITGIKIKTTADLKSEGVKQLSLKIEAGGNTIYNNLIFDSLNSNLPLKDGVNGTEYTINVPNGVIRVVKGQSVNIEVSGIADTSTNTTAGDNRLGPGEKILDIELLLADPLTGQPIVIPVEG